MTRTFCLIALFIAGIQNSHWKKSMLIKVILESPTGNFFP